MADDKAEEKKFPPTARTMQRLRQKDGLVPRANDLYTATSLLAIAVYFALFHAQFLQYPIVWFSAALRPEFWAQPQLRNVSLSFFRAGIEALLPVFLLTVAVPIFTGLIDGKGLPISAKAISLDFNRLNPVEGVKKIFSLSSLSDLLKGLARLTLISVVGYGAVLYFENALFWSPMCGDRCEAEVSRAFLGTIVVLVSLVVLLVAFVDVLISRALFRREHRMTVSEMKREQRESTGDPHIRRAIRSRGRAPR